MTPDEAFARAQEALTEGRELTIRFANTSEATRFRHACNSHRKRLRRAAEDLPATHPMWGRCVYDEIAIAMSGTSLIFKHRLPEPLAVEVK